MLMSAEQMFSDGQALAASGASTNYIDLGAPGTVLGAPAALVRDIGPGQPVAIYVHGALTAADVIQVAIQVDDNTSFSSARTVLESEAFTVGADGDWECNLNFLPDNVDERYMRLSYTLTGTGGTVDAGIVAGKQTNNPVAGA